MSLIAQLRAKYKTNLPIFNWNQELPAHAQVYLVGGAVRDMLLGVHTQDRDFVVVGTTPQAMIEKGFIAVGKDFPVFLHPRTKEEYALARTERKSGVGHKGFVFHTSTDITLEQDLMRRDFTINAMAQDLNGNIIDPYGGRADLAQGILRHVSAAFSEDPLRVMRLARFYGKFPNFNVHAETLALAQNIVKQQGIQTLSHERIWQELSKALLQTYPERGITMLEQTGAMEVFWPTWQSQHANLQALSRCHRLEERFAILSLAQPQSIVLQRIPKDCDDLAYLLKKYQTPVFHIVEINASTLLTLLEDLDYFRRPWLLKKLINCANALEPIQQTQRTTHLNILSASLSQLSSLCLQQHFSGIELGKQIRIQREHALHAMLLAMKNKA